MCVCVEKHGPTLNILLVIINTIYLYPEEIYQMEVGGNT